MNENIPGQQPADDDFDEELALTFLSDYQAFEQALLRAGFIRAGRAPGNAQPDWEGFARHIEARYDPDAEPGLRGAALTLLVDPDNPRRFRRREWDPYLAEPSEPERNTVWLAELVGEIRNKIFYGINLMEKPDCGMVDISAAMYLLENWAHLDPAVKRSLADGQ